MPDVSRAMTSDRPGSTAEAPSAWDAPQWTADDEDGVLDADDTPGPPAPVALRVRRHREMLAVSLIVLVLAFAMVELPGGRVAVRGLTAYPLPPSCATRSLMGVRCPGCGLTRSFIHLAEGDWRASWQSHRLGWLMAASVLFQLPYRLLALRRRGTSPIPARWLAVLSGVLIALLIINWLADVVTGRLASL